MIQDAVVCFVDAVNAEQDEDDSDDTDEERVDESFDMALVSARMVELSNRVMSGVQDVTRGELDNLRLVMEYFINESGKATYADRILYNRLKAALTSAQQPTAPTPPE